ncbi:inhibitor of Bruton tyrosine kinase-like [Argonauta hians]
MSALRMECGPKCHSKQHASQLNAAITKGSLEEIKAYFKTCHAAGKQSDADGNLPLHVAAGCGKLDVVQWLLQDMHADVNAVDRESRWTPLHKALFYGYIDVAALLIQHGANLGIQDNEGLRPFNIQRADERLRTADGSQRASEVYAWGVNHNSTLGLSTEKHSVKPSIVDTFQQQRISIKQVILCKYHTVFLSSCGRVYTCGHGGGGRLGVGDERTYLTPKMVKSSKDHKYRSIAASDNHTVMVTDRGKALTCGSNDHYQLCQSPPPATCLEPTLVSQTVHPVIGCCTGLYHTVLYTPHHVFSAGFNGGQLGPVKGDPYQKQLTLMLDLSIVDQKVRSVRCSDAATVCLSSTGHTYVFHEFQCRKITSDFHFAESIVLTGGNLNLEHLVLPTYSSNTKKTKASLNTNSHLVIVIFRLNPCKVCIWWSYSPTIKYCRFDLSDFDVKDICLSKNNIGIVTNKGEAYVGPWKKSPEPSIEKLAPKETWTPFKSGSQWKVMHYELIHMKRLPYIHRATHLVASHNENNFAVVQTNPFVSLKSFPVPRNPEIMSSFRELAEDCSDLSLIHDLEIKSGCKSWFAHRYIMASNSKYFESLIVSTKPRQPSHDMHMVTIPYVHADLIKQMLQFIYTNTCDLLTPGAQFAWSTDPLMHLNHCRFCKTDHAMLTESDDPVAHLVRVATTFDLHELAQRLDVVYVRHNRVQLKKKRRKPSYIEPTYDLTAFPALSDITLRVSSESKEQFKCHKCILVAQSEYFRSMFSCVWRETSANVLTLSFSADVLRILLQYFYTNSIPTLQDCNLLLELLAKAEEILLFDLKNICESQIINSINMTNILDLLQFAIVYNADNLRKTCLQGICDNITHILELRLFDHVKEEVLSEVTKYYRETAPCMERRLITPYTEGPDKQYLEQLARVTTTTTTTTNTAATTSPATKAKPGQQRRRGRHKSSSFSDSKYLEAGQMLPENNMNNNNNSNVNDNNNNNDDDDDDDGFVICHKGSQKDRAKNANNKSNNNNHNNSAPSGRNLSNNNNNNNNNNKDCDYNHVIRSGGDGGGGGSGGGGSRSSSGGGGNHKVNHKDDAGQKENKPGAANQGAAECASPLRRAPTVPRDKDNPWSLLLSPVVVPGKAQSGATRKTPPPPTPIPHPPVMSLANIMDEQLEQSEQQQLREVKSRCQSLKTVKSGGGGGGGSGGGHDNSKNTFSWGLTSCRNKKLSESSGTMEATSPTSPPPPPPPPPVSPWQVKKDPEKPVASVPLAEIVKDEMEKSENLLRTRNKTLHYIQMEEKAMSELLAYYMSEVSFDETISVEREHVTTEQPMWNVANRKKTFRYSDSLLSSPPLPHTSPLS